MNKIKELEEQLAKARIEAEKESVEKYKHLIGKCFRRAFTSFEYVTGIISSDDEEVTYNCVKIYIDIRYEDSRVEIDTYSCGTIEVNELESRQISRAEFDNMLQVSFKRILNISKVRYNEE